MTQISQFHQFFDVASYTYSSNRKQIVASVGSDSYTFDNFGNITTDASRAYSFNWENRLASVTKSSVTTVYDYDEEGIRVKKTTPSKVTQYIDKFTEIDDTDVIRHIFAGNKRIASIDGAAAVTYNHEDHLGSSNIRTDSSGSVIKSIEYLPFGEKRTQSGSYNVVKNRFTGQYEDEESDLYYYQQRYYDPTLSRFITADPLYLEEMEKRGTDTQELNVYAYVRNNPLNSIDPNGTAAIAFQGDVMGFFGFRGFSNSLSGVLSIDFNPLSKTFLRTEIGGLGTSTQKFGLGLAASGELGVGISLGNSSIKDLAGPSVGLSAGLGIPKVIGVGGSASYGDGVLSISAGLKGPGVVGYGSFDISNSTSLGEKTLFKGVDLFEDVRSYFADEVSKNMDTSKTNEHPMNGNETAGEK